LHQRTFFLETVVNRLKALIALSMVGTACIAGNAYAWARVGVFVGGPVYYPYAPPPVPYYYYPPPPVYVQPVPAAPVTYVEQGQPAPAASPAEPGAPLQEPGMWYYCDSAKAYYPYVKQCSGAWRGVPASPPPSN
jgi:hypothetical protein